MFFVNDNYPTMQLSQPAKSVYTGVDRRCERRRRTLKGAFLEFNNGYSTFECVLRDMTSHGARVSMGHTTGVPTRFKLTITGEQTPIEAIVRWRTPRDMGLGFLLRGD